jgi:hypothetical protein
MSNKSPAVLIDSKYCSGLPLNKIMSLDGLMFTGFRSTHILSIAFAEKVLKHRDSFKTFEVLHP